MKTMFKLEIAIWWAFRSTR